MPFRRLSYSHSGLPLLRLVLQLKSVFSIIQLFLVFARQSTIEKRCLWKSKGLVHCPGAFNIKIVYVTVLLLSLFITMSRMLSLVALLTTRNHRRIPVEWKIVPTYSNWINKNYVACFEDYRVNEMRHPLRRIPKRLEFNRITACKQVRSIYFLHTEGAWVHVSSAYLSVNHY